MGEIYEQVWRNNLEGQGFYLLDVGPLDSHALRKKMLEIAEQEFPEFQVLFPNRFNQQRTTRFHRDGGPELSILMLGYEPSEVQSSLYIADHTCAANDLGISPNKLISDLMWGIGEERLDGYITELKPPKNAFILIINNSDILGVAHKAAVVQDHTQHRIINSMMMVPKHIACIPATQEQINNFLTTESFGSLHEDYATS